MGTKGISKAGRFGVVAGAAAALALGVATAGPAAASAASGSRSASVANDTLTVAGSSRSDRIALRLAAGDPATLQVDFGDDGSAEHSFDRGTFSRISVFARSGRDQVRMDEANGAFADETATVDGGSGDDTIDGGAGNELLVGGSGDDAVDGNGGADTGQLGSGQDSFRWDPGDGSDVVEGRSGVDTLDFNGAGAAENMSLSADGRRSLFLRDVGNIRMDMDDVERLDLTTLGGADTVAIGDMSGTDVRLAGVDLSGPAGGGDGQVDAVTVSGTERADRIDVEARRGRVEVDGLRSEVEIRGSEPTDRLTIDGRGGNDDVDVDDDVEDLIAVAGDPGAGQH